jgi:rhamnulokinase
MGIEVRQPIINAKMLDLNFTNEGGVGGTIRLLKNIYRAVAAAGVAAAVGTGGAHATPGRRCWPKRSRPQPFQVASSIPTRLTSSTPSNMVDTIRAFCRRTGQPEPQTVGEVVRCCLESLALRYRWVVERAGRNPG